MNVPRPIDQPPPPVAPSVQLLQLMTALTVKGFGLGTAIAALIVTALSLL